MEEGAMKKEEKEGKKKYKNVRGKKKESREGMKKLEGKRKEVKMKRRNIDQN